MRVKGKKVILYNTKVVNFDPGELKSGIEIR